MQRHASEIYDRQRTELLGYRGLHGFRGRGTVAGRAIHLPDRKDSSTLYAPTGVAQLRFPPPRTGASKHVDAALTSAMPANRAVIAQILGIIPSVILRFVMGLF